jgi:hypothetical protein
MKISEELDTIELSNMLKLYSEFLFHFGSVHLIQKFAYLSQIESSSVNTIDPLTRQIIRANIRSTEHFKVLTGMTKLPVDEVVIKKIEEKEVTEVKEEKEEM